MTTNEPIKQQPYVRMVIGEVAAASLIAEFVNVWNGEQPDAARDRGFIEARLMIEEGGRLLVVETVFATREDCIRYHSSRAYRRLIATTQHLLVGDFVVKLFRQRVP